MDNNYIMGSSSTNYRDFGRWETSKPNPRKDDRNRIMWNVGEDIAWRKGIPNPWGPVPPPPKWKTRDIILKDKMKRGEREKYNYDDFIYFPFWYKNVRARKLKELEQKAEAKGE